MNDLSDVVRLSELVPDLPMARNTVYAWAKRGKIPSARQIGGTEWVVSRKAVEAWLTGPVAAPPGRPDATMPAAAAIPTDLPKLAELPETSALKALRRRLARPAALDRRTVRDDTIGYADPLRVEATITQGEREQLWTSWMLALVGLRTLPEPAIAVLVEAFELQVAILEDDGDW